MKAFAARPVAGARPARAARAVSVRASGGAPKEPVKFEVRQGQCVGLEPGTGGAQAPHRQGAELSQDVASRMWPRLTRPAPPMCSQNIPASERVFSDAQVRRIGVNGRAWGRQLARATSLPTPARTAWELVVLEAPALS